MIFRYVPAQLKKSRYSVQLILLRNIHRPTHPVQRVIVILHSVGSLDFLAAMLLMVPCIFELLL